MAMRFARGATAALMSLASIKNRHRLHPAPAQRRHIPARGHTTGFPAVGPIRR